MFVFLLIFIYILFRFVGRVEKWMSTDISLVAEREKTIRTAPRNVGVFDNLCQVLK